MTGNHLDVVKDVRRLLDARGQKWETNCDALEITGRVAWRLRDRGAVLLTKVPAQNGCTMIRGPHIGRRVSHDAIGFPDGWVDILASAGPPANENGPIWDWHDGPPATGLAPWDLDAGAQQPDQPGGGNGETTNLEALVAINLQLGQVLNMTSSVVQSVRALPRADQYDELVSAYKDLSQRFVKVVETLERIEKRQKLGVRGPFSVRTIHLAPPETT